MNYEEFRKEDGYFYYAYKIVNKLNQNYYIGIHKTKDINDGYMGSGIRIKYAIEKYGINNFEKQYILFLDNYKVLLNKEKELVTKDTISDENCYNIALGGRDSFEHIHKKWKSNKEWADKQALRASKVQKELLDTRPEYKEKIMDAMQKMNNDPLIIEKRNINFQKYIDSGEASKVWLGKSHKQETKDKIGKANSVHQQGEGNSMFGTCWVYNDKESLRIKKEDLDNYLEQGWIKGRKIKF